ncbi:MAG: CoA-binding protein [Candidatus Marinimicrobia bacterium]|nr:CoA-binding protein [Candidatus Neomarinimicrobiota bacterium]MCF7827442.1 CoA-binding protein [Candidatus Neomarinimicrobiota bacterium]MCF7882317.1 CoA-binding protein [Candidatus Neomarinimicrobiota bacterium]
MDKPVQQVIREFLAENRFALAGVSREPKHFSRTLFSDLRKFGYDVLPINPNTDEIDGQICYNSLTGITPPVSQLLVLTPDDQTLKAIAEAPQTGIERIWLYGISGAKDVLSDALQYCHQNSIDVVPGYCPYMFIPEAPFFHKIHTAVWKMLGKYPE